MVIVAKLAGTKWAENTQNIVVSVLALVWNTVHARLVKPYQQIGRADKPNDMYDVCVLNIDTPNATTCSG